MSTKFKLTRRDGLTVTRLVTFTTQPSWPALSTRIHTLFGIPIDKVGVSYVDSDADEVTLSSEDELREYYQAFPSPDVIKFVVQDLSRNEKALPDTPRSTAFRNTFGVNIDDAGLPFDIEDDWQRLPPLSGMFVPPTHRSESPHAFIRVVGSDATSASTHDDESDNESEGHSTTDFGHVTSTLDKGKARAVDPSPAPSVVADDLLSLSSDEPILFEHKSDPLPDSPHSTVIPLAEPSLEAAAEATPPATGAASTEDASDPPLPTIDPTPEASLTNDVATLLVTLTNVVSAHPELSEGLRNIVQNATNGTYWTAHRAAVSQAAGDFVQTTSQATEDIRRRAEEEAGKRVADALGGMLRTFSQVLGTGAAAEPTEPTAEANPEDPGQPWRTSTPTAEQFNSTSFWYGRPPGSMWAGSRGDGGRHGRPPLGPPPGPPHGQHWHPGFPHGPPPPGGPAGFRASGPFPHFGPPAGPWSNYAHWAPPPPPPPPPPGPPPGPPPPPHPPAETRPKPTPQELRAQVEAAKLLYKVEKERYRAEREERRKARDSRMATEPAANAQTQVESSAEKNAEPSQPSVTHLVSTGNPKVGYPQLEMYSVPQRNNTYHGQPSRRYGQTVATESSTERVLNRITKRLAAMGITDKAHPTLPAKIKEQLPVGGNVSEEAENNIVSTLVEELLFMSPKPTASGSGLRPEDNELPGAWA